MRFRIFISQFNGSVANGVKQRKTHRWVSNAGLPQVPAANGGWVSGEAEAARTLAVGPRASPTLPGTLLQQLATETLSQREAHVVPREDNKEGRLAKRPWGLPLPNLLKILYQNRVLGCGVSSVVEY